MIVAIVEREKRELKQAKNDMRAAECTAGDDATKTPARPHQQTNDSAADRRKRRAAPSSPRCVLGRRQQEGYLVETRSDGQAVICRRHPLYLVLRWLARGSAEQRLVVSVDAYGEITAVTAEPLRR